MSSSGRELGSPTTRTLWPIFTRNCPWRDSSEPLQSCRVYFFHPSGPKVRKNERHFLKQLFQNFGNQCSHNLGGCVVAPRVEPSHSCGDTTCFTSVRARRNISLSRILIIFSASKPDYQRALDRSHRLPGTTT